MAPSFALLSVHKMFVSFIGSVCKKGDHVTGVEKTIQSKQSRGNANFCRYVVKSYDFHENSVENSTAYVRAHA